MGILKWLAGDPVTVVQRDTFKVVAAKGKWQYEVEERYTVAMEHLRQDDAFEIFMDGVTWAKTMPQYHASMAFDGMLLHIKKGYRYNGASIPPWFRSRLPPWLEKVALRSALGHDVGYQALRLQRDGKLKGNLGEGARRRFDLCFRDQMAADLVNAGPKRAQKIAGWYFRGVRAFGWLSTRGKP